MYISVGTFESFSMLAALSSLRLLANLRCSVSVKMETGYEIQDVNFYAAHTGSSLEVQPAADGRVSKRLTRAAQGQVEV